MEILAYYKQTENKLRWDAILEKAKVTFSVYIPKWRVPEPCPNTILVILYFPPDDKLKNIKIYTKSDIDMNQELRNNKISVELLKKSDHTKTIRFDPTGNDKKNWEVGSLYIPKELLPHDEITKVSAVIEWMNT